MIGDTCGCCQGPTGLTPGAIENRPGLSAISYRVGTFGSFRASMLHKIASTPELVDLRMRRSDDYAITILELWAAVADVLTFYQERAANEAFLRSSLHRDSMLRLVRLIAYELAPGTAATTLLAFSVDQTVTLPQRLRVQSVPSADNDKPQKFETLEEMTARPALNEVRAVATPFGVNPLAKGSTKAYLVPGVDALKIMEAIAPDDHLLLFNAGANDTPERLTVRELRVEHDRIELAWDEPLQGSLWNIDTTVLKHTRSFQPFGHNAPTSHIEPASPPGAGTSILDVEWMLTDTDFTYVDSVSTTGSTLALDALYEDIGVGTQLLVVINASVVRYVTVTAVAEGQETVGPVTDTVTKVEVSPRITELNGKNRSKVQIHELAEPDVRFWGHDYPSDLTAATVLAPGLKTADSTIEVGRLIDGGEITPGAVITIAEIDLGRRVILTDENGEPVSGTVIDASVAGRDVLCTATPLDLSTASELGLDEENAEELAGIVSAALENPPTLTSAAPQIEVTIGTIGPYVLDLSAAPTDLDSIASELQLEIRAADANDAFTGARVLAVDDSRIVVVGGDRDLDVVFAVTADDETTIVELGLDPESIKPVAGTLSAALVFPVALTYSDPEMQVTIGVIGPLTIAVAPGTDPLESRFQAALRAADPSPAFDHALVIRTDDDRLVILPGVVGDDWEDYLRLDISTTSSDPRLLDGRATTLRGNIAEASHGETVSSEVVGNADATVEFQEFTLKKSPVTHLTSAASATAESTLQLVVSGSLWTETPTLYGYSDTSRVYRTRIDDDGVSTIVFGGGGMGAIPQTGRDNIVATYRTGLGLDGRVGADSLLTLLDRPNGLSAVTNPTAADGGADPESLDDARENAPATVMTFGRAVSLRDFEYLSKASGEVAKSLATWVWHRERRAVHLTIAAQEGAPFSEDGIAGIHAGLTAARDPNHTLLIDNYVSVQIRIEGTIHVLADRIAPDVDKAAHDALLAALSFDEQDFGRPVHLSDVYRILQEVDGVEYVDLDLLMFKKPEGMSHAAFDAWLSVRGVRRLPDGIPAPLQGHLRIHSARTLDAAIGAVLPAELAIVKDATRDVVLTISGGLPG